MMPILILAAGASTRMRGVDKLLQDVDGMPLLRRQTLMALDVGRDVRGALPPRPHDRYATVADLPVRVIEVADAAEGMGASLRAAFAALVPGEQRAMLLLADLPDLVAHDLQQVIDSTQTAPDALIWRGATADGKGGHPLIFDRSLFAALRALSGDEGGNSVVRAAGARVHLVPFADGRARRDLDTPEDWAAWYAARP